MAQKAARTGSSTALSSRRRQASETSRERSAVARAIKAAIKRIARYDPELAEVLESEIKTGQFLAHIRKGK
jgi:hypothetical protein